MSRINNITELPPNPLIPVTELTGRDHEVLLKMLDKYLLVKETKSYMKMVIFNAYVSGYFFLNSNINGLMGNFVFCFKYNREVKASEATTTICAVYGENAIVENTARK
ncbi:hypothetical protein RN001_000628 [Aquatica leii]|uniref:Mos1 transposase HTH domain-containing protein n=1 Tax=Aquatica leii TaxID=1421715 RepID=A0AAN7SJ80_9COLE|nr:hypothetical protein RN001_000628 [Aquatica leii]